MRDVKSSPTLKEEEWTEDHDAVADELRSFIKEFESFTPELFTQIKFHLLRGFGLTKPTRDEFCALSIQEGLCPKCDLLYTAKKCFLWYRLFKIIKWETVQRAPPCIRLAFAKKSIKTVAIYLTKTNLIHPPFYRAIGSTSCNMMRRWGYCNPNEYCNAMETDNTLEYTAARELVKQARKLT
ncbi:MAG: hypothetical protein ACXABH_02920 [Candidatus Thorarchaeota archaeon]|jgi:hypothetical protein